MSTQFGVVSIGRNNLVEFPMNPASEAAAAPTTDAPTGRTLSLSGQESYPAAPTVGTTQTQLSARRADVEGMAGSFVPVTFTDKSELNGYYIVSDASTDLINWEQEAVTLDWKVGLVRIGTDYEVDIESRLTGGVRNNSFSAAGTRWHAPAIGHLSYFTAVGNTPSQVTRTGADGAMTVYFGLPISGQVIPRWYCPVGSYLNGRSRFLDSTGLERSGILFSNGSPSVWTLSNALVQVTPLSSGGVLSVSSYSNGAYQAKSWDLQFNGTSLGAPISISLLRNEPEIVVARLLWAVASIPARVTADLTLRRGSRFLELYVQTQTAGTIKVVRSVAEAGASGGGGGYVSAVSEDGTGTRYVVGSALAYTQDLVNGGASSSAATTMDAFIGAVASQTVLNANPDFETGVSNWTPTGGTFVQSAVRAHKGSFSALMTPSGSAALCFAESEQEPVTPLATYYASAWCWPTSSISNNVSPSINFYDATHTYIETVSSTTSASSGQWNLLTGNNITAPASAHFAEVIPTVGGTPSSSNLVWWDEVKLRAAVPAGDSAADLYNQYVAAPSELVQGVRR